MRTVTEKVELLCAQMKKEKIDYYIIPSADYHQSEYVGEYFKARAFISGFSGSAGTALVGREGAYLWTDGRYFLQAEKELSESPFALQRMGEADVPSLEQYLEAKVQPGETIGFDGRVISLEQGNTFAKITEKKGGYIRYDMDMVDKIWTDRPALSTAKAFLLEEVFTGESVQSKLKRVRRVMEACGTNIHVLTSLDDICWLFHIRGNDIAYSPLVLSYAIIGMDHVKLYVDEQKLNEQIFTELKKNGVEICPYDSIYETVKKYDGSDKILLDPEKMNYALYHNISDAVRKVERVNPTTLMKAVKNPVEIENIWKAHIKDGVAVTKFLYWLKAHIGKKVLTEMDVSDKLEEFRREQDGFICPSFAPISAYQEHAAIVHYESVPETNATLKPSGLLLMDTGGQYYEGTTDITRTIALGPVSKEEKEHFTIVVMSMLALANAHFQYGCDGVNLDAIARQPFWKRGLDFNHGTGHGVGYLMNVHEGPNSFRWKRKSGSALYPLEEGMVTTDEPGFYLEGKHGIRIENELLTVKERKNVYGQFMKFEYLTFVPIDLEAIDPKLMSVDDVLALNQYHKQVYQNISPYLNEKERVWLNEQTRSIQKERQGS